MSNKLKNDNDLPLIVANWKMNGYLLQGIQFLKSLRSKLIDSHQKANIVICPPYTLLRDFAEKSPESGIKLGAQNCHDKSEGAYTGSISAKMLRDMACEYVILGHSERRTTCNEGSELVSHKAESAHSEKLKTIICVGETIYERENDLAKIVVREQVIHSIPKTANIENTIIAYEPVWAIGSGKVPSAEEIEQMHSYIKEVIEKEIDHFKSAPKVIYGGSINSQNSQFILKVKNVDGLLIGKSSLDVDEFVKIIETSS